MVGVVLAGGAGSRMASLGLAKPAAPIAGRPMIEWPLRAVQAVCEPVAVVCKASTELPPLPEAVERWEEPDEPRHPLTGIVFALERAGADVLVCAADMPFVGLEEFEAVKEAARREPDVGAVVAEAGGRLEPALGIYRPSALGALRAAPEDARFTVVVEGLEPVRVPVPAGAVRSVNTPDELAAAEAELAG